MKSNCISWAVNRVKSHGGYLVVRWTRMNKWKWIRWPHVLWLPKVCPKDGEPCCGLKSFVPNHKPVVIIPPLRNFEGQVKDGDE